MPVAVLVYYITQEFGGGGGGGQPMEDFKWAHINYT